MNPIPGPPDPVADADDAVLRTVPDLRGLEAEDASGLQVGRLFGALAEADTGLLRYLDLALQASDRHVLVPIGHARVLQPPHEQPLMRLRAALLEDLERIPPFPADVAHVDDPFERALLEAYGRTFHGERYYAHPSYDHSGLFVGEHLVVGAADEREEPLSRLSYMSGWRVAPGEPDVRDWPLLLDDGADVRVIDLIVDAAAEKVRYVVLELGDERAAVLPVGFLHVERAQERVRAPGLVRDDLQALPAYDGGGVTRVDEERVHAALRRCLSGARRYLLPDFRSPD